ncbi:MAG: bifunctional diaminohydroxyphosphoribosylaminopyrimidine deaminase/5-amino-6-(5-phosphoribosylamino)uracil reductase [Desulfitibacter sp. BRH_c19]|nr:MAG: bifunctional diaminohydroxyphosphoribosylaminopyrimidine deaminase/5-amino-6-(5-phosphoribosylamino)uracil reductase [Desulfitibacter sp. BRH_c19]
MERALKLAAKGKGFVSPNPMVGAVLVNNDQIVGEGFHQKAGGPHAEVHCLQSAGELARNGTLYVNLEPCSHHGRTPPCTEAILRSGISKVVIAMHDPNPLVSGRGIKQLQGNGLEIVTGVLEDEAKILNEVFIKYITSKKPFVAIKVAGSLDGKIATKAGDSKWITGPVAREYVHQLRNEYDSILVGINTVLTDNPSLNCRLECAKTDPIRIVLDSSLKIPLDSKIIDSSSSAHLIVFTLADDQEKISFLEEKGVEVIRQTGETKLSINFVMSKLAEKEISSVLVEGGSETIWSFFQEGFVDKYYMFIAPKIIGGREAVSIVGGEGIETMDTVIKMKWKECRFLGNDLLVTCYRELF